MTARMYHENSKPQALPSKRNGLPRGQVSFPGVRGKERWVAAVPLINEMVVEVRKRIPADAILLRASTGCLESDLSRPRARFRRASSRRRDATFTLATRLGAQALAMRGVLPTRLSAVVEAARMDVLCAAPPLADGASAASWCNHLATHGRTLKLGGGICQSAPLNQKLQNRPLFSHYPFLLKNRASTGCLESDLSRPRARFRRASSRRRTAEGWSRDASQDIAGEVLERAFDAVVARLVEQTTRRRRHAGAGTQHTSAHLASAEQAVIPRESWG